MSNVVRNMIIVIVLIMALHTITWLAVCGSIEDGSCTENEKTLITIFVGVTGGIIMIATLFKSTNNDDKTIWHCPNCDNRYDSEYKMKHCDSHISPECWRD